MHVGSTDSPYPGGRTDPGLHRAAHWLCRSSPHRPGRSATDARPDARAVWLAGRPATRSPPVGVFADRCRVILAEIRRPDGTICVRDASNVAAPGYGCASAFHLGSTPACLGMGIFSSDGSRGKFLCNLSSDLPDRTIRAALDALDSIV